MAARSMVSCVIRSSLYHTGLYRHTAAVCHFNGYPVRWLFGASESKNSETKSEDISGTASSEQGKVTENQTQLEKDLLDQKSKLEEKVSELDDKYKRALAENENIRQRMMRQIKDAKQFGIQGFCKDLLEVADILNTATVSVPAEELTDKNPHLKNLYEGLKMTDSQLQKVFRLHGLVQVNPLGEKFNPNQHEALFEEVVEGKPVGTVSVVTKIGYQLHERVIRPALVGVVKSPEKQ